MRPRRGTLRARPGWPERRAARRDAVALSVVAICWALNLAPVPAAGAAGRPAHASSSSSALANNAGPDGTGAF